MTAPADVLALAQSAGLYVGSTIDVVFTSTCEAEGDIPMLRELIAVDVKRERGADWLIWRWKSKGANPWGGSDCGHAGNIVDAGFLSLLSARAGVAP
jgi:hypothetical protein